jgi:hypothetical protein
MAGESHIVQQSTLFIVNLDLEPVSPGTIRARSRANAACASHSIFEHFLHSLDRIIGKRLMTRAFDHGTRAF